MGRPLQTQLQRPVLTGSGLGQAGKAGAPQQRLGQGLRPGLCSWSSCSGDLACMSSASWEPRASITELPCLEQRCLGWVGLSCGGGAQLGGTRKRWGAGTLVLRAVCAVQRLEGCEGRSLPAVPQGCQKARPLLWGPASWSFRPPLGRIWTLVKEQIDSSLAPVLSLSRRCQGLA